MRRLFYAVSLGFSALFLVLSLLTAVRTTEVNDHAAELAGEIAAQKTENEILLARCESSVDLITLERYAREELGLQLCGSGQIYYINLNK